MPQVKRKGHAVVRDVMKGLVFAEGKIKYFKSKLIIVYFLEDFKFSTDFFQFWDLKFTNINRIIKT